MAKGKLWINLWYFLSWLDDLRKNIIDNTKTSIVIIKTSIDRKVINKSFLKLNIFEKYKIPTPRTKPPEPKIIESKNITLFWKELCKLLIWDFKWNKLPMARIAIAGRTGKE